ncbi:MAG: nucleotide sugar dehydrogenase, partial [Armatimonadota bacterium]|nr:nucleotide sugar dehydrogenase [Armatimonadota bacterium]
YCPERTMEGKALQELKELPQIVAGIDKQSEDKAVEIFSKVTSTVVRVESLEAAELLKLVDNAWRDLIFAFANEVALLSEKYGINGSKLIKAANLGYPRNNIPVPGFAGGACLSKDPYILTESALNKGYEMKFPVLTRTINERFTEHAAEKVKEKLASLNKEVKRAKIFILGIAFKGEPETDDVRGSPTLDLVEYLNEKYGCTEIYGHDFTVPSGKIKRLGIEPCSIEEGFKDADCIIVMTAHRLHYELDIEGLLSLVKKPAVFFDGWGMFNREDIETIEGIIYTGIGIK